MAANPEYRPTPFVLQNAWPEFMGLRAIGGTDLVNLTGRIYKAFGQFHRRNDRRAEALEVLPMRRMPIAPTFIYEHRGVTRPLLVSATENSRDTLIHSMFVLHGGAYREVRFERTLPVRLLLSGARRIHGKLDVPSLDFDMTYYLIKITELTAQRKGI